MDSILTNQELVRLLHTEIIYKYILVYNSRFDAIHHDLSGSLLTISCSLFIHGGVTEVRMKYSGQIRTTLDSSKALSVWLTSRASSSRRFKRPSSPLFSHNRFMARICCEMPV
jgi:hypothetical protein